MYFAYWIWMIKEWLVFFLTISLPEPEFWLPEPEFWLPEPEFWLPEPEPEEKQPEYAQL